MPLDSEQPSPEQYEYLLEFLQLKIDACYTRDYCTESSFVNSCTPFVPESNPWKPRWFGKEAKPVGSCGKRSRHLLRNPVKFASGEGKTQCGVVNRRMHPPYAIVSFQKPPYASPCPPESSRPLRALSPVPRNDLITPYETWRNSLPTIYCSLIAASYTAFPIRAITLSRTAPSAVESVTNTATATFRPSGSVISPISLVACATP